MRTLSKAFAAALALSAAASRPTVGAAAGPQRGRVPSARAPRTVTRPAYYLDWDATSDAGGSRARWRVSRAPAAVLGGGPPPPPGTFPTLAAPALRDWIGHLPPGSRVYGLLIMGHGGSAMIGGHIDRRYTEKELLPQMRGLSRFCQGRRVLLDWASAVD